MIICGYSFIEHYQLFYVIFCFLRSLNRGCWKQLLSLHPCSTADTLGQGADIISTLHSSSVSSPSVEQAFLAQKNPMTSLYREMAIVASPFLSPLMAAKISRCSLTVRLGQSTFS